jgi:DNA-binding IclR family transcriptional regulator
VDRGSARANITVVSAPVYERHGRPVLAITASALSADFTEHRIAAVGSALRDT